MKFIKIILAILGLIFGVMLFFWLFGLITSLLWYGFWIGLLAAVGYGGYKLFKKLSTNTSAAALPRLISMNAITAFHGKSTIESI